ncbi:GntG family PLP-dependent aldolase [Allonocardiopsis opalescens]|uniref:L-threonine aldolase n=1 Tax=Allonocardiopsis opalescens TaxID=1144618 RepID=A0A2T0PYB6_9ACTN|nr:GntG family PLP-dependent aldolase [Allonocardiopsis opalescens]PRX96520.1 L-threonine aldolase [Allonocardiopsis opalescens]
MIELRSDTFTLPTARMRAAMADAEVGNDVYGEDPTVRRLEERAAELLGAEAACLTPTGTMANLCAILSWIPRGGKLLCGDESDIYLHEAGGASVCGSAVYAPVPTGADGSLSIGDLAAALPEDPDDPEFAPAALICLENTHNRRGGRPLGPGYLAGVAGFAREHGLPVHLDGARLFNAAVSLGVAPAELARHADSAQFCLSKGLGAPVGSVLTGSAAFIRRARRVRKMLGGGMRQSGVVAAAGLVALAEWPRLAEDHAHAARLAAGLAGLPGVELDPAAVRTNIVIFRLTGTAPGHERFIALMRDRGVALAELGRGRLRAVTHAGVSTADVDRAVAAAAAVLDEAAARGTASGAVAR